MKTGDLAQERDSEFVDLLTQHQLALQLYVRSLLPGEASAADVAQLANQTIWKKRDDFEIGTNFKAWIFNIARYEVLNFRKQQARDSRLGLVFSDEMQDIMSEELPEQADDLERRHAALKGCLEDLKPADRDLIQHRYFCRSPLKEYAQTSQRSVGGLKVTLHRIRNALAACIETKLQQPQHQQKEAGA